MGQAVRLALAGIRARAASSTAVLLLLVVTLATPVVGPVFLRAADESAVRRAVGQGPTASRQISVTTTEIAKEPGIVTRAPEVALAKLRGLGPWQVVAFGLLEVVLLVLAALPPALAVGVRAARLAGAGRLTPGTPVVLTRDAVLAGVEAVVVAVLAAGWVGREALRTPASALLRTTSPRRRHARDGAGVTLVVVALAAAGAAELGLGGGGLRADRLDVVALAAPGALALAAALVGARLIPLACRLLVPLTRSRGPVSVFLAVRQLARRPDGGRSVVVIATAFGLAAFAVFAASVQAQNRHDRALVDNGAATVFAVRPNPGVDLQRAVRAADPGGHAMAALQFDSPDSNPGERRLLAVDSTRLAAVAFWRDDLTESFVTKSGRLADLARALAPPVGAPVVLQGDNVELTFDAGDLAPPEQKNDAAPNPPVLTLEIEPVRCRWLPPRPLELLVGPRVGQHGAPAGPLAL